MQIVNQSNYSNMEPFGNDLTILETSEKEESSLVFVLKSWLDSNNILPKKQDGCSD